MDVNIHAVSVFKDNYVWLIINENKQVIVVDPGDAKPVIVFLKKSDLKLSAVFLTHHHYDHTNGVAELIAEYPAPIYASEKTLIKNVTHKVNEKYKIQIPNFPIFNILDISGHTLDHVAYYAEDFIFTGDTIFAAGCGKIFEGDAEMMYASLQKLAALPVHTKIYCGHEYTEANLRFAKTVEPDNKDIDQRMLNVAKLRAENKPSLPSLLSDELKTNVFLRCQSVAEFARLRKLKDEF